MSGLFGDLDPQPKSRKAVDRMLETSPSREQLLANMVNGGGTDFSSVEIKRKRNKQEKGRIEPPINYISDD